MLPERSGGKAWIRLCGSKRKAELTKRGACVILEYKTEAKQGQHALSLDHHQAGLYLAPQFSVLLVRASALYFDLCE